MNKIVVAEIKAFSPALAFVSVYVLAVALIYPSAHQNRPASEVTCVCICPATEDR